VFTPDGARVTPKTHPQLFGDPLWGWYWIFSETGETAGGQYVPTRSFRPSTTFSSSGGISTAMSAAKR
jgi:hypothetical protein